MILAHSRVQRKVQGKVWASVGETFIALTQPPVVFPWDNGNEGLFP